MINVMSRILCFILTSVPYCHVFLLQEVNHRRKISSTIQRISSKVAAAFIS